MHGFGRVGKDEKMCNGTLIFQSIFRRKLPKNEEKTEQEQRWRMKQQKSVPSDPHFGEKCAFRSILARFGVQKWSPGWTKNVTFLRLAA